MEIFLLAVTSIEVVFRMPFLCLSNSNWEFVAKKLIWRSFAIAKTLPLAKRVGYINNRKFVEVILNKNANTFVVYVAALEAPEWAMLMQHLRAPLPGILQ